MRHNQALIVLTSQNQIVLVSVTARTHLHPQTGFSVEGSLAAHHFVKRGMNLYKKVLVQPALICMGIYTSYVINVSYFIISIILIPGSSSFTDRFVVCMGIFDPRSILMKLTGGPFIAWGSGSAYDCSHDGQ